MNVTRKLISSSMLRNLEFLVTVLVTLIMSPFIIHSLGDRLYGYWALIGTFMGYYGLLDLGLSSAANRFISQSIGRKDNDELSKVVSTSYYLFTGIGVMAIVLTGIVVVISGSFIDNPEELDLFRRLVALMGVNLAFGFPMKVYYGILSSYLRYDYLTSISVFKVLVSNMVIYLSLRNGSGLFALAVITFVGSMCSYLLTSISCRRLYPDIRLARNKVERARVKSMFGYSWKSFIAQIADMLRFRVDSVVIASFLNVSLVTYYSVGARLMEYFVQLMISCTGFMLPVFSQYEGKNDYDAIRKSLLKATKASTIIAVYVGMSILFYGKDFILRWMGPGFTSSYEIVAILVIPYIIALSQTTSISVLYGISKHHFFAVSNICEGVLNFILSIILVQRYGIYGVALGTAIVMVFFKVFIQPVFTCRALELNLKDYYIGPLIRTALRVIIILLSYFSVARYFLAPDYLTILILGSIQTAVFIPLAYYLVLGRNDRSIIKAAFKVG